MQAHLIGWCAGTAISFTSLSVLTSAENFKISISKLVFGPNFLPHWTCFFGQLS